VIGQGGDELAKWSFREFSARGERWTRILPEGFAVVQAVRNDNQPVRLEFTIKEAARESKGGTVLSRQDPNHIRDKDISAFAGNAAIMEVARSVAKLSFPIGDKLATCTGFMVTADLLLTNHHCVSTIDTCFATVAIFGYQRDASSHVLPTKQYDCIAVIQTNKTRDYSLLQIDGSPGAATEWGILKIGHASLLAVKQPVYMVQHPSGEPKRVALDNCKVSTPNAAGTIAGVKSDFGHICDTESGSSGSPVLDLSHHVVGLHHLGFDAKNNRWSRENRAVYIGPIATEIDGFLH
jgi:V8-like Glu-specific endopeptidase